MNKILGIGIIITLLVNVLVMLIGFSYLQDEINQLKTEPDLSSTPKPTSTPPTIPEQSPPPEATVEPSLYDYVVFEWYLKAEYINNVTWLNMTWASYDFGKTWSENYIAYIDDFWAIPQGIADSDIGVLAKAAFVIQVSANVSFNEATGFTKVLYQYSESDELYYAIESSLPRLADTRGWTKTYI